ncbi:hypothetical protein GDO81_008810 [Engystomops pustulosus]|uniref:Uncharacterized protein n=1 Tax=Engystomops pustulosus TaxID=76066 RepID=A0AAV7CH70_ENGPU|nr:hypothetical protein GDO81_008810 [Engystomops pustulosus]
MAMADFSIEYSEDVGEFYIDDLSFKKKTQKTHIQLKLHKDCWSPFHSGVKSEIRKPGKPMSSLRKAIMLVVVVEKLKGPVPALLYPFYTLVPK